MRVALLLLVLLLAGCARSHLFYDTRELRHAPLQREQEAALNQTVADKLGDRGVTWVDVDGHQKVVAAADIKKLGLAERGALWLTLSTGDVGGESDVRVRIGKGSTPVTVYVALDGSVRVVSGRRERDDDPAPDLDEIRARFSLEKGFVKGDKWSDGERRALAQSLASLAPQELAIVRDIRFDREAAPRDKDPARAALYEMNGCRAKITLYSSGVRADAFRFVGNTAAPRSAVLHSIVHEVGHAFEQAAAREKFCAAERAKGDKANTLIAAGNDLTGDSPVLDGYAKALGGEPAPTDYGNTSPHESFAESFALFHVDPEALQRTRPGVFAWFAKGRHLARQSNG